MNEFSKALLELSKECSTEYVTSSRCITPDPCWVFKAIPSNIVSQGDTGFRLRNGELSTSDVILMIDYLWAAQSLQDLLPVYFNKGLYCEIYEANTRVMLQYLPD